jgi:hypothetical protein
LPFLDFAGIYTQSLVDMTSDSASRGPAVIATSIAFTILAAFFVATRFLARAVFLKSAGRDEFAILGSLVSDGVFQ